MNPELFAWLALAASVAIPLILSRIQSKKLQSRYKSIKRQELEARARAKAQQKKQDPQPLLGVVYPNEKDTETQPK